MSGSSPLILAEITLDSTSVVPIDSKLPELAVIALTGEVRVNDENITSGQLVVLRSDSATTLSSSGTAVVLGGEPVAERTIWWNFVHSDPDRIEQAKSDWDNQKVWQVPHDHVPHIPLPS